MTIEKGRRSDATVDGSATQPLAYDLRIDGRASRNGEAGERGVNLAIRSHPRLSWQVDATHCASYEVEVCDEHGRPVWFSGRVESTDTFVTVVVPLRPHQRYLWTVRVHDHDGRRSPVAASEFETGPLTIDDWRAAWVTAPTGTRIRHPFDLSDGVARARLYVTGQGLVRAELNGTAINPGRLDPTRTDVVRALYRAYDVTDLLKVGPNALDFVLGSGEWIRTGIDPRLFAELVVWHPDGSRSHIGPDATSVTAPSRVVVDDPFYLERHDTSVETDVSWTPVSPAAFLSPSASPDDPGTPPSRIEPDPTPATRVVTGIAPVEIGRAGDTRLFDVGTNIAGRSRIEVLGTLAAGATVRVVHGEHVGADGRLDTTNLMMPFDNGRVRQVVEWVGRGTSGDVIEAWFAYHGFRYIEVQGLPEQVEIVVIAEPLHTDLSPSGQIRTDNDLIEQLLLRAERTLLNNVHGVPEDCPTREQAAWTGDTASVAEYELAAFDTENFLGKWVRDLITSQGADGALPAIAPEVRTPRLHADPVWGAALHRVLIGHWLHYGDAEFVREALPALRAWALFQLSCVDEFGVVGRSPISYGHDWLALEQTPPAVHHTGATIDCLVALARLEADLGDPDAAIDWIAHADSLRGAARALFYDPDRGVFANGSQGSFAVAIEAGILVGADADRAAQRIEDDVRLRGNRLSGGFATTRTIVRALTSTGRSQVVADMLAQPAEPGIGAMLASGPGTFWECWWIDPTNTGTGSLDHVGLGGVFAGWAWEGLAGLTPTSGGYRTFSLAPQFVTGVDELQLRTRTPVGEIVVDYRIDGAAVHFSVEVPDGATATLELRGEPMRSLDAGRHVLSVPVRRSPATPHPSTETAWSAPSIAPRAGDVTGPVDLLAAAIATDRLHAAPGSTIEIVDGLDCMPIPHAQAVGPVAEVVATLAGERPTARIDFAEPLDASTSTFAYALIDLCDERMLRGARPTIRVLATTGEFLEAVAVSWPAGWNRVAVDLADFAGRGSIAAIEVSILRPVDDGDDLLMPQAVDTAPGGFHLGEIGLSTARRTW